jgi:hypothetical protein
MSNLTYTQEQYQEVMAQLAKARAENDSLRASRRKSFSLKVGDKGGICICGLQKYPIHMYKEQALEILDRADEIRAFIRENDAILSVRG